MFFIVETDRFDVILMSAVAMISISKVNGNQMTVDQVCYFEISKYIFSVIIIQLQ